jgi:FixJ family two-component response regulator
MKRTPVIGLVDDETCVLRALARLLSAEGFEVRTYDSARRFLECAAEEPLDCLVLDVTMPGMSGLELQEQLIQSGIRLPVVFLTGRGDIPMSVRAMKAGAVNFLTKPVNDADLLSAVRSGLALAARERAEEGDRAHLRVRLDRLTPREREVFRHVIAGLLNKQIAAMLGTSEQTIKVHRMRLTMKMGLFSVADLVRAAQRLGVMPAEGWRLNEGCMPPSGAVCDHEPGDKQRPGQGHRGDRR